MVADGEAVRFVKRTRSQPDAVVLVEALLDSIGDGGAGGLAVLPAWRAIAEAEEQTRNAAAVVLHARLRARLTTVTAEWDATTGTWSDALRRLLPDPHASTVSYWSTAMVEALVIDLTAALGESRWAAQWLGAHRTVHLAVCACGGEADLRPAIGALADALHATAQDRDRVAMHRELWRRLCSVLGDEDRFGPDAWMRVLRAGGSPVADALGELLASAPSKPSARFAATADAVIARCGAEDCRRQLVLWLQTLARTRPRPDEPPVFEARTIACVVGAILVADRFDGPEVSSAIADLGIAAYRKVPTIGARCAPVGTACRRALAGRADALPQLARMQQRVTHPPSRAKVAQTIAERAQALGVSARDLAEIVVPDFGLDSRGALELTSGDIVLHLRIDGDAVDAHWIASGRLQKSLPARLRAEDPDEAAAQRAIIKQLKELLPVQRRRLEDLLREDRQWSIHAWRTRYAEHPVVGTIARRMVWRFADADGERAGLWVGGGAIGTDRQPLPLSDATVVRLWHPVGALDGEAAELASLLAAHDITQPFAQLDRGVWRPPPAGSPHEFAGVTVRQHVLAAILHGRGWRYELRSGWWDSDDSPTLALSAWNIDATLHLHEPPRGGRDGEEAVSERGVLLHVTLGDVSFATRGAPLAVADVPALAYCETMRDVALVAAAAAEPR
jgi:hypothetical protein